MLTSPNTEILEILPGELTIRDGHIIEYNKWNFLHHPRLTSGEKDEIDDNATD